MTKKLSIFASIALLIAGVVVWQLRPDSAPVQADPVAVAFIPDPEPVVFAQATPRPWQEVMSYPEPRETPVISQDARFNYRDDGFNEMNDALALSATLEQDQSVQDDVHAVEQLFRRYHWAFGEMPVGSENSEFVLALLGQNRKNLILLPHSSSRLSMTGELLDRWGTPYFFHTESSSQLEVRSAGPDRKMWNDDDVLSAGLGGAL